MIPEQFIVDYQRAVQPVVGVGRGPMDLQKLSRNRGMTPLEEKLHALKPKLAEAAQRVYDAWDASDPEYGDPEVGFGGICHEIADEMGDVLNEHGIDYRTMDNNGMGDQHVWIAAHDDKHAAHVDIEPHHYETGGGYNWQKIPDVQFEPDHVDIIPAERSDIVGDEEDEY